MRVSFIIRLVYEKVKAKKQSRCHKTVVGKIRKKYLVLTDPTFAKSKVCLSMWPRVNVMKDQRVRVYRSPSVWNVWHTREFGDKGLDSPIGKDYGQHIYK